MNINAAAIATKEDKYQMSNDEIHAISGAIFDASHNLQSALHNQQCKVIADSTLSRAARVEIILQLAELSKLVDRTCERRCNQIEGA